MKLNLDKQFVDLVGEPLPAKMDDTLANVLALSSIGDPDVMIKWATDLLNNGEIEISETEAQFITWLIKNSRNLTNLAKSQLLEEIERVTKRNYSQDAPIQDDCDICEKVERDLMRKVKNLR
jgi:hypothetical protein